METKIFVMGQILMFGCLNWTLSNYSENEPITFRKNPNRRVKNKIVELESAFLIDLYIVISTMKILSIPRSIKTMSPRSSYSHRIFQFVLLLYKILTSRQLANCFKYKYRIKNLWKKWLVTCELVTKIRPWRLFLIKFKLFLFHEF